MKKIDPTYLLILPLWQRWDLRWLSRLSIPSEASLPFPSARFHSSLTTRPKIRRQVRLQMTWLFVCLCLGWRRWSEERFFRITMEQTLCKCSWRFWCTEFIYSDVVWSFLSFWSCCSSVTAWRTSAFRSWTSSLAANAWKSWTLAFGFKEPLQRRQGHPPVDAERCVEREG